MKIAPRAEVEQLARREYRKRYEKTPEPVVINVEPLIALHAPRLFRWGGISYRAPPVSYPIGVRLLVAANALRDLRVSQAPAAFVRPTLRTAARTIRRAVSPVGIIARVAHPLRRCPFANADPVEVEGLLRWLIQAPDESPVIAPAEKSTVDLIDAVASFARAFPAWTDPHGWPISYAHYLYGARHLSRLSAREDLRHATATRFAHTDKDGWEAWADELRSAAGW